MPLPAAHNLQKASSMETLLISNSFLQSVAGRKGAEGPLVSPGFLLNGFLNFIDHHRAFNCSTCLLPSYVTLSRIFHCVEPLLSQLQNAEPTDLLSACPMPVSSLGTETPVTSTDKNHFPCGWGQPGRLIHPDKTGKGEAV